MLITFQTIILKLLWKNLSKIMNNPALMIFWRSALLMMKSIKIRIILFLKLKIYRISLKKI